MLTRAAISLTYDDGMSQHLDHAIPDLESNGLRGTFYVPTGWAADCPWHARASEWTAAASRGHEIGNHTHLHPCRSWREHNLENYTLDQITAELRLAQDELTRRVGPGPRSFAYPCCHTTVGPADAQVSYVEFTDTLFVASRVGGNCLADPASVDLRLVPSFMMHEENALARALALMNEAIAKRQWLVLTFHGVGGGHLDCSREHHQVLCQTIAKRAAEIDCGTVAAIAMQIRAKSHRQS